MSWRPEIGVDERDGVCCSKNAQVNELFPSKRIVPAMTNLEQLYPRNDFFGVVLIDCLIALDDGDALASFDSAFPMAPSPPCRHFA